MQELKTRQEIEQASQTGRKLVVFSSPTCKPCQQLKRDVLPRIEPGTEVFVVNAQELGDTDLDYYNLLKVPTLILYQDGVEIKRHVGTMDENINRWLA